MRDQIRRARAAVLFSHQRAEHHAELQALALVNGHQAHHIVVFAQQMRRVAIAARAQLLRML